MNSKIADHIFLRNHTVQGYRHQLIEKTETENTADLVRFAFQNKLLYEIIFCTAARRD